MTGHLAVAPAAARAVSVHGSRDMDTAAAFADLVCADHELLRAEFEAIVAANFPDAAPGQGLRPTGTVRSRTGWMPPRHCPVWCSGRPGPGGVAGLPDVHARQRGPPETRRVLVRLLDNIWSVGCMILTDQADRTTPQGRRPIETQGG